MSSEAVDVVVIGGGPAGSTVSTLLAQRGVKVRLYERDTFPRFHIGESLIPETYWVFKRLNMLDKMKKSPFVKKHSVQFVSASGRLSAPFYFEENKPHECSQTWQVIRSEFDTMMLDNAREHGVDVRQPARVLEVLFEGDRAVGVKVQKDGGGSEEVRAQGGGGRERAEHDAPEPAQAAAVGPGAEQGRRSGRTGRARTATPGGTRARRWSCRRRTRRAGGGTSRSTTTPSASAWWPRSTTCSRAAGRTSRSTRRRWRRARRSRSGCRRARGATGYYATKDYSYRSSQVAGDGWVLIGDAFGFLDPLYSSGVLLALKSGDLAADAIADGLAAGDTSAAQLGRWGEVFGKGVDRMRRLVCEYYDGFSFGKFVKTFPELKGTVTDLLIGDLFDERVDKVWGPLESLYPPDKKAIPAWSDGAPPEAPDKVNELFLPEDPMR